MLISSIIFILLVIFTASILRSAFGFGDALIAMPLLALFIDVKTAVPLVALMGFTSSILILSRHWRIAYTKGLWILILFCIIGIFPSIYFLKHVNDSIVKTVLAFIIIFFSTINLLKPNYFTLKNDKLAWFFGLVSGMLGGAYNTNGPPVIIYGKLKKWESTNFRAILQSVFLPTNFFIILGQGFSGFWSGEILKIFMFCLPLIIIGTFLGGYLHKKMQEREYNKAIDILLMFIGLSLLIKIWFF